MNAQQSFHLFETSVWDAEEAAKNARNKRDAILRVVGALLKAGVDSARAYPTMDVAGGTIKAWNVNGVRLFIARGFSALAMHDATGGEAHESLDLYPGFELPASAVALLVKP